MAEALWSTQDLVTEILSYLSAKEIHRLQCVCKSFETSSSSGGLLTRLQTARRGGRIDGLISHMSTDGRIDFHFFPKDNDRIPADVGVPRGAVEFLRVTTAGKGYGKRARIVGSTNGVMVFEDELEDVHSVDGPSPPRSFLYTYNPVNRTLSILPHPTRTVPLCVSADNTGVVAYLDGRGGYRLLLMAVDDEWRSVAYLRCWVYSFASRSWGTLTRVRCGPRPLKLSRVVMSATERKVYVVSDCSDVWTVDPYVLQIDVDTMTSRILPVPEGVSIDKSDTLEIGMWGKEEEEEEGRALCLVRWSPSEASFFIWVMEDSCRWRWRKECIRADLRNFHVDRCKVRARYLLGVKRRHQRRSRWWAVERDLRKHGVRYLAVVDGGKVVFGMGDWMYTWSVVENRFLHAHFRPCSHNYGYVDIYPYSNTLCRFD